MMQKHVENSNKLLKLEFRPAVSEKSSKNEIPVVKSIDEKMSKDCSDFFEKSEKTLHLEC